MYNDELPIFRPDLGGKVKKDRVPTFRNHLLKKFAKLSGGQNRKNLNPKRGGHPNRGYRASYVKDARLFSRRVVVKARIVKMNDYGKKSADLHLNYIEREGVEKDGSKGKLFGPDKDFDRDHFTRHIKSEPHQFRFIISPEDAHDLDLTQFTRELVEQMEKDLGRKLEWSAVNHYNTDNPHTHVIVRGLDRDGKELRIDRDYISHGIRNRAREIATRELGLRTDLEIEKQIEKEINAERVTSIDFKIENQMDGAILDLGDYPDNRTERYTQGRIISRLEKLESLGLANHVENRKWELADDWKENLKNLGERNDIIKTMHRSVGGDPGRYRILDPNSFEGTMEGKLVKKGLFDEMYDRHYFIVETLKGETFFINLDRSVDPSKYQEGEVIKLDIEQEKWLKPSDQNIADIASKNSGIYSKEKHFESIDTTHVVIESKYGNKIEVATPDFVKAHERRLKRLLRFKLVNQLPDGTWAIPDNLVDELAIRDKEKPINKLKLKSQSKISFKDQINYKGRTWLDRYACKKSLPEIAKFGFGAEVSKLARIRANYLMNLDLDPLDPSLTKKLDKLEYNELGKRLEKDGGIKFKGFDGKPLKSKGKLEKLETLPSGRRYAQITDLRSRQFVLVPWKKYYESLRSKTVEFSINKYGRTFVKKLDLTLGR